ncbi:MAG: hypothetical protein ACREIJ_07820 [Nitrospiraceae bacterium]
MAAFQYDTDAQRFYEVLGKRLGKYGLTLAAEKTRCLRFSRNDRRNSEVLEFLGFEFRWGLSPGQQTLREEAHGDPEIPGDAGPSQSLDAGEQSPPQAGVLRPTGGQAARILPILWSPR